MENVMNRMIRASDRGRSSARAGGADPGIRQPGPVSRNGASACIINGVLTFRVNIHLGRVFAAFLLPRHLSPGTSAPVGASLGTSSEFPKDLEFLKGFKTFQRLFN